ncbi:MAG: hypothetical protein E6J78_14460 [Deltaproteobacteria bacterium]|nr:MAG: hypothetical protein E6J78_14460 [Deltaproteobacteria bacterium]
MMKLNLSMAAALALTAVAAGAARAQQVQTGSGSGESCVQFNAAEEGSPDSIDYANRATSTRSATNDEIYAGEKEDPDSVDYAKRQESNGGDGNARALFACGAQTAPDDGPRG